MGKLTTSLLVRASNCANAQAKIQSVLTAAFLERYGVTYSDVDADDLIDTLDYGLGEAPTLSECDAIMIARGHPPRTARAAPREATP